MQRFFSRGITIINIVIILGITFYLFHFKEGSVFRPNSSKVVEALENELLSVFSYSGEKISRDFVISLYSDTIRLKDLNLMSPKIVLRMSQLNCSDCLEREVRIVEHISKDLGIEGSVLIFVSYNNLNDLNAFIRINNISLPVYIIDNEFLNGPDSESKPYYFILDNSLKGERVYFPINEEVTEKYFKIFKHRYLSGH